MRTTTAGLLMIAGLAAGCAYGPDIRTSTVGDAVPAATSSSTVGDAVPAATSFGLLSDADPAVVAAVVTELQRRGWRIAERNAPWQVEVLRTSRNEAAGAFTAELRPKGNEAWEIQPSPRRWWRRENDERGVALALIDAATGRRVARGEAWTRRRADQVSDERLVDAAIEALLTADPARPPEMR